MNLTLVTFGNQFTHVDSGLLTIVIVIYLWKNTAVNLVWKIGYQSCVLYLRKGRNQGDIFGIVWWL
jgi:hypothetical protein